MRLGYNCLRYGPGRKFPDDWAFIANHTTTDAKTETFESPTPTSVEFEDTFERVMEEALRKKARRIVIVLDNLDRVEREAALAVWATLQVFFQQRQLQRGWFDHVWVIVPYDPNGLKRLWPDGSTNGDSQRPESFIDKTFQIRFRVPPPVLSNWRAYLLHLIEQAFPDCAEDERNLVYQVFDNYFGTTRRASPSPRQLKLFVNQVAALTFNATIGFRYRISRIMSVWCGRTRASRTWSWMVGSLIRTQPTSSDQACEKSCRRSILAWMYQRVSNCC